MKKQIEEIERLLRARAFANAEDRARRLVDELPVIGQHHLLLGQVLYRQGKVAEAVESFERAAILDPDSWRAHLKLAQSLDRAQRYEEALRAARKGQKVNPNRAEFALLIEGLERIAKPERTDGWERSVFLDHHHVELTHEE